MPTANRTFGMVETVYRLSGLWDASTSRGGRVGEEECGRLPPKGTGEGCGGVGTRDRYGWLAALDRLGGKNVLLRFPDRNAVLFLGVRYAYRCNKCSRSGKALGFSNSRSSRLCSNNGKDSANHSQTPGCDVGEREG